jgi:hypothetical protein
MQTLLLLLIASSLHLVRVTPMNLGIAQFSIITQSPEVKGQVGNKQPIETGSNGAQDSSGKTGSAAEGGEISTTQIQNKAEAKNVLVQVLNEVALIEIDSDDSVKWKSMALPKVAELAWDSNRERVRGVYVRGVESLLSKYENIVTDSAGQKTAVKEKTIEEALNKLIKWLESKDVEGARTLWGRFYAIRKDVLEKKSSPGKAMAEYAALSRETLNYDVKKSIEIAQTMLSAGVPPSFAQFLLDLRGRDKQLADELFKYAVNLLAKGVYGPRQAIILSHYAFQERLLILPTPETPGNGQRNAGVRFGIYTSNLKGSDEQPSPELMALYLSAALSNIAHANSDSAKNPSYAGESLFLAKKIGTYANKLKLGSEGEWNGVVQKITVMAEESGIEASQIAQLISAAERTVADPRQIFLPSESAEQRIDKAASAKSEAEKNMHHKTAIRELADNGNFDDAEKLLSGLTDQNTKSRMSDYIHFRRSQSMIERKQWHDLFGEIDSINEAALRFYLFVSAARAAETSGNEDKAVALLQEATRLIEQISAKDEKAKMLLAAASVFATITKANAYKTQYLHDSLSDAIRRLNDLQAYDYKDYQVKLVLDEKTIFMYSLRGSDFESCFEQLGAASWEDAKSLASNIESDQLRLSAQIAYCRGILQHR